MQHIQITEMTPEELFEKVGQVFQEVLLQVLRSSPAASDEKQLLTVQETATFLSVTRQTVHEYVRTGKLRVHKIGARSYFMREELLSALQREGYQRTPKTSRTHGRR